MILHVVSSTITVTKWGDTQSRKTLSFEVVPKDRGYIEIGDKYVVASAGYHRLLHKDRQPVTAKVNITSDRSHLDRKDRKPDKDVCGWAAFYPERQGQFDYDPPMLEMVVVVEAQRFDELCNLRIGAPDAATIHIKIDGLEFGWEPDGSHEIWKIDEDNRGGRIANTKPINSFWISVNTFDTTEQTIRNEVDRKTNQEFAESHDPELRKLADPVAPPAEAATKLLEQCRALLIAILAVAAFALFKR